MNHSPGAARLMVVGAAVLFSTGGAAIKATTLNGWQTAGFRSLVASLVLLVLVPEARRGWNWRITPVALAYAATLISFVMANKLTTSANAIFLQSTSPAYLLFLGPLLLREPVRRLDVWFTAALAAGMGCLFAGVEQPVATAPNPPLGNTMAVVSGVTYAFTLTGLRWLARRPGTGSALTTVAVGNALVFALCLPMALPVTHWTAADSVGILYLGCIQIGVAYWLLTRGVRQVSAFETSALLLAEPVLNPLWSWWIHGERPGPWAAAGGAIIVGATVMRLLLTQRQSRTGV